MARASAPDPVHVALLRGVNVGGKNKLAMTDLAELFRAAGCAEVRTYIQSGNVLFRAPAALAATLSRALAAEIERRHGLRTPVVTRSAARLAKVARSNPFLAAGADPDELHVAFLADPPARAKVAALDPRRSPPDEFVVAGSEVFLRCPGGVARTKLTNDWFDRALATTSTLRNWRTVTRLVELAAE
jgi:uncharacterized protein (DUF1697 family)